MPSSPPQLSEQFLKRLDPFLMANSAELRGRSSYDILPTYSESLLSALSSHTSLKCDPKINYSKDESLQWAPVRRFRSPVVWRATLPGPLHYLRVRKPGADVPQEVVYALPLQGHCLMTDKDQNLFIIHINALHIIDDITCLSNRSFRDEPLVQLYGKHESLFGNLWMKYKLDMIEDLFEYFTQPWMSALYQEPFEDVLQDIRNADLNLAKEVLQKQMNLSENQMHLLDCRCHYASSTASDEEKQKKFEAEAKETSAKEFKTFKDIVEHCMNLETKMKRECGIDSVLRAKVREEWDSHAMTDNVDWHVAKYLQTYNVANKYYAVPGP